MTEQEKREKAIAKMIKDADVDGLFNEVPDETLCTLIRNGGYRDFANAYDAGYRKEEDVLKEADKNAYNVWKGIFGLKEKATRDEARKAAIIEVVEWFESNQVCAGCEYVNDAARKHFGLEVLNERRAKRKD